MCLPKSGLIAVQRDTEPGRLGFSGILLQMQQVFNANFFSEKNIKN